MLLYEKYRPNSFCDVIGQDAVLETIQNLRARGLAGRAWWIKGQSGTGKTTIAKLLAKEIADEFNIDELDATKLTPAKLHSIEQEMQMYGFGGKGRAYIINEAHGLRRDTVRQLLVLLERLPNHVIVIFTTTNEGEDNLFDEQIDAHPLLSRCQPLYLARRGLAKPFAERARQIADAENLNGKPIEFYVKLVRKCKNNMRAVLQEIESGAMLE